MFDALKAWWAKRTKKPEPTPVPMLTPEPEVDAGELAVFVAELREDWEGRIVSLRALEKESTSDGLRGKWRARRETYEELLSQLPAAGG